MRAIEHMTGRAAVCQPAAPRLRSRAGVRRLRLVAVARRTPDVSGSNGTSNGDTTSVSTPKAGGDVEPAPSSARLPQAAADAASDAVDAATGLAASMVQGAQDAAAEAVYTADQLAYNAQQGVVAGISGLAAAADEAAGAVLPRPSSSSPTTFNMGGYRPTTPGVATYDFDAEEVDQLKIALVAAVASLDRGLAANLQETRQVDQLAAQLEGAGGSVVLDWKSSRSSPNLSPMDMLSGTWRLIYSSGFNGGSLGGRRPGPPAALFPAVLGQVYQVVDARASLLDNVVELLASYGLPRLPFLGGEDGPQPTPGVRLTLRHDYEVSNANIVRIVYEDTFARLVGPEVLGSVPVLQAPQLPEFLKPPRNFRAASFAVTFLDDTMRVTRGDRGELRIYLRDEPLDPVAPDSDDEE